MNLRCTVTPSENIGPYTLLEKLGQGGMGVVYKARDNRLRRLVALKFLAEGADDPRVARRFLREAQAASALNHQNIVCVYDIGDDNGVPYMVMEYVEGRCLKDIIPLHGLPLSVALDYALQIASGVCAAHRAGIVHRDLKPANVIADSRGVLKVLDFGLARLDSGLTVGDEADAYATMTHAGTFIGTAAYVAPEQSTGKHVDHRADIFSFGIMLHEMLTGGRPFAGSSVIEILYQVNKGKPVGVRKFCPDLPADLENYVLRMLAKSPDHRFQTMETVIAALQPVRAAAPELAPTAAHGTGAPDETRWSDNPTVAMQSLSIAGNWSGASVSRTRVSGPPVPGSEKAAIAVVAFRSLSPDKDDEYLAEGIASEVVRALSGVPGVRVVSELTSYRFRNELSDLKRMAESLNLDYILTGSLRRAGTRIRVIAELCDASNGTLIWSQTYDRGIEDVFAVQEDIAQAIVSATGGQILKSRTEQASFESPENLDAWGLVSKANHVVNHAYSLEAINEAVDLLRTAIAIAPDYAGAHGLLGLYLIQRVVNSRSTDPVRDRQDALAAVDRALQLAPNDPEVLEHSGLVYTNCGKSEQARRVLRRAVKAAPFNLVAWGYLGLCLGWTGSSADIAEAQRILDRLIANTSDHPSLPYWLYFKAGVCAREGKYEEAADCAQRSAELQPRFTLALMEYANALGYLGRAPEAVEALMRVAALNPGATQEMYTSELLITTGSPERVQPHVGGLIAAGLFQPN